MSNFSLRECETKNKVFSNAPHKRYILYVGKLKFSRTCEREGVKNRRRKEERIWEERRERREK